MRGSKTPSERKKKKKEREIQFFFCLLNQSTSHWGSLGLPRPPSPPKCHGILSFMDLQKKPCVKCGQTDRNPSGRCRPCKRAYREAHGAEHRESMRKWRAANRGKVNTGSREYVARVRREALEVLGLQCSCPGCTVNRYVFLSIDHIDGGGNQERQSGGSYSRHRWITRNPEEARAKFQTLCFNCNYAKHFERGGHTCLAH